MPAILNTSAKQKIYFLISSIVCVALLVQPTAVRAAANTYTVCSSGCDFTSVAQAFGNTAEFGVSNLKSGDTVVLRQTGNPATEYKPEQEGVFFGDARFVHFPGPGITLDCQNNPIAIGVVTAAERMQIQSVYSNTVIKNCNFTHVDILLGTGASSLNTANHPVENDTTGFQFLNNTFATNTVSSLNFGNFYTGDPNGMSTSNFIIRGNKNINDFDVLMKASHGVVDANTFYTVGKGLVFIDSPLFFGFGELINDVVVTNNTFTTANTSGGPGSNIGIGGTNVVFAHNTINFVGSPLPPDSNLLSVPVVKNTSVVVENNIFDLRGVDTGVNLLFVGPEYGSSTDFSGLTTYLPDWLVNGDDVYGGVTVKHNTIRFGNGRNERNSFIKLSGSAYQYKYHISVTSTNNIVENSYQENGLPAYIVDAQNNTLDLKLYDDFNGLFGFGNLYRSNAPNALFQSGGHDQFVKPFFKTTGTGLPTDYELAPFSPYLGINNGTGYAGAVPGVRRNTIRINANTPVDYTTNDAQDVTDLNAYIRNGDTVQIAPGTYSALNVGSATGLQNISIFGKGPSSNIAAAAPSVLNNISNLTLSNLNFNATVSTSPALVLQNVQNSVINAIQTIGTTAASSSFFITPAVFAYQGVVYNSDIGHGANTPVLVFANNNTNNSITDLKTNPSDITQYMPAVAPAIHVALVTVPSQDLHLTMYVLDSAMQSPVALTALLSQYGARVDAWFPNVFTPSNGVCAYNAPAGAIVTPGSPVPSVIRKYFAPASIEITNSNNNILSSIGTANTSGGIFFSGTSQTNIVSSSVFSNSTFDIRTNSSKDNIIKNSTFDKAKIAQLNTGKLIFSPDIFAGNTTATTPPPTYITKDMQIGTNDPEVLVLHALLEYLLYKPYQPRTTLYNVTTSLWVDQFKKHYNLPTNGKIAGPARDALNQEIDNRAAIVAANQPYTFTKNLGPGWAGVEVLHLQMKLRDMGYYNGVMDGVLDVSTQQALKKMQTDYKVTNDGVVRQTTMNVLNR